MYIDLSEAGSIASLFSLAITACVFVKVRSLHLFYKRHLILPQFTRELSLRIRNARKALEEKRTEEVTRILRTCDALLERLPKYADKALSKRVKSARASIKNILKNSEHKFLFRCQDVLSEIEAAVKSATIFTGEDKWKI